MRTTGRTVLTLVLVAVVAGVAALVGLVTDLVGRDRAFTITDFDRQVAVGTDGTLAVTEVLAVTFHEERRGIFRDLPTDGPGGRGTVRVTDVRVDQGRDDEPWTWVTESAPDGGVRIRIGDAATWLSPGDYTYRLRYDLEDLTFRSGREPGRVQVRLDVPGFDWPTDIEQTSLTVTSHAAVVEVICVAGPRRSVRACDPPPTVDGTEVRASFGAFRPGASATVAVDLDAAAFAGADLPTFREDPLDRRDGLPLLPVVPAVAGLIAALVLAVPFVVFEAVKARLVYRDVVTDPQLHDRAHPTAVFGPPHGFRPVEVAGLLLRRSGEPLLLGTLVDLDQRGIVRTEGAGTSKKPVLTVHAGPEGVEASRGDATFLRTLLPGRASLRFDGEYDKDASTRTQTATHELVRQARSVFADHGYEHDRGRSLRAAGNRALLAFAALVLLALLGLLLDIVLPIPGGAVAGIAGLVVAGWVLTRAVWRHERLPLNSEGRDAVGQARSFEEFLRTVESEQLEWAADQPAISHHHPAVSLLPYAIVLGLADSWYRRFGSVIEELAAAGVAGGAAAGTTWWATQGGFRSASQARSGTTTAPSSSGGSFGGGGGGSGGGGGGGGSW
jgi:uncharacterized membrane protein YgcG